MDTQTGLLIIYALGLAIVLGFYLWTFTKAGKRWIENI